MEIYCYRVVYPSGVFVRVTPDVNGEKTGEIIPCGATFRSMKSLFLDGINYVQLEDSRGWIFSSLNGKMVLELVELVRIPRQLSSTLNPGTASTRASPSLPTESPTQERKSLTTSESSSYEDLKRLDFGYSDSESNSSDSDAGSQNLKSQPPPTQLQSNGIVAHAASVFHSPDRMSKLPQGNMNTPRASILQSPLPNKQVRMEQKWREARIKTRSCQTFDDFTSLIMKGIDQKLLPPVITEPGPARSAWMATVCDESERKLSGIISTICGVTRQCADTISDTQQLESHLWILSHLGASEISLVMKLLDKAAQSKFEEICHMQRDEILTKANEVCRLSKPYAKELTNQLTTMIADDVKNFLQRWIILKVIPGKVLLLPPMPPNQPVNNAKLVMTKLLNNSSDQEMKEFHKTPISRSPSRSNSFDGGDVKVGGIRSNQSLSAQSGSNSSYISMLTGCEPVAGVLFSPQAKSTASKVVDAIVEDMKSVLSGIWGDPDQQFAHVM